MPLSARGRAWRNEKRARDYAQLRRPNVTSHSSRQLRDELEWRARSLFGRAGHIAPTLYSIRGGELREHPLTTAAEDALGKAALAVEVALEVGRARPEAAALLLSALGERGEYIVLLIDDGQTLDGQATAFAAVVSGGRRPRLGPFRGPADAGGLFVAALRAGLSGPACPGCAAPVGAAHRAGCDVERCSVCRRQFFLCGCPGHERKAAAWAGVWPGVFACRALGWYCRRTEEGWRTCAPGESGAREDLNRFYAADLADLLEMGLAA